VPGLQNTDYSLNRGDMADLLRHEYFLPDATELSKKTLRFPCMITVPRIFTYRRIYSGLANIFVPVEPWYSPLYKTGHQSRALELTGEIVKLLVSTAQERGKPPLVFMLLSTREILYYQSRG